MTVTQRQPAAKKPGHKSKGTTARRPLSIIQQQPETGAHEKDRKAPAKDKLAADADALAATGLRALFKLETAVRKTNSVKELIYLIANQTRSLVPARQTFLVTLKGRKPTPRVQAVSSVAVIDRNTPMIRWIEKTLKKLGTDRGFSDSAVFTHDAYAGDAPEARTYPFPHLLWVPLKTAKGRVFAGLLVARERPWLDADRVLLDRLAEIYAYSWQALAGERRLTRSLPKRFLATSIGVLIAAGLMLIDVPLTALAPAEITARKPEVVTAPLEGVIKEVLVDPNTEVKAGQPLFRFNDTELANQVQLAERKVRVQAAKLQRISQGSFIDAKAAHELKIAKTELDLAIAERDFARARHERALVRASRNGLAIFSAKDEWVGRPVALGERIMQIADPKAVEIRIELPIDDAIMLRPGADVKLFLDADPLHAIAAKITQASFHAKPTPDQKLAYIVHARLSEGEMAAGLRRIGLRGTAQLFGDPVPLYFYLFRRPIAAFRQMTGL